MAVTNKLVLASGSPRRLQILNQAGVEPDHLIPTEIDETPRRMELPRNYAVRLAREKVEKAMESVGRDPDFGEPFLIAADTVVSVGRRILPKAELLEEAENCLRLLSGRAHRVHTAIAMITPKGALRQRTVETRVRFKRLSREDRESYLASGEWRGKAGGYAIQGLAGSFVIRISGSYTNVVGLPLYEVTTMLAGEGYPVHFNWITRS